MNTGNIRPFANPLEQLAENVSSHGARVIQAANQEHAILWIGLVQPRQLR